MEKLLQIKVFVTVELVLIALYFIFVAFLAGLFPQIPNICPPNTRFACDTAMHPNLYGILIGLVLRGLIVLYLIFFAIGRIILHFKKIIKL